ncbi:tyrosine-type recombinase/integrase [Pyruvatibacter sp.]
MATYRERNGRTQAIIRRKLLPPLSKTFSTRTDAEEWALSVERDLEARQSEGDYLPADTLGELLVRYRDTVTPRKKGAAPETFRLNGLIRSELGAQPLRRLRADAFAMYRDRRLKSVKPSTVVNELGLVQHALKVAQNDWGWDIPKNPLPNVSRPKFNDARNRRLLPGEEDVLLRACRRSRSWWLEPAVVLALETSMRRGELLSLRRSDLDRKRRVIRLHDTKNGHSRLVALSTTAYDTLIGMRTKGDRFFPCNVNTFRLAWVRTVKRSGLEDFRFHDLRHEAISRLFEKGLGIADVAMMSGHRDVRMLFRYTHMQAESIVSKLG